MRSWFTALVIVGGLLAQPGDAWAGKLAEKGGFREFKLGAEVTHEWLDKQGCSITYHNTAIRLTTYDCVEYRPVGDISGRVYLTLVAETIVKVNFDSRRGLSYSDYQTILKIMTEAFGEPAPCSEVAAYETGTSSHPPLWQVECEILKKGLVSEAFPCASIRGLCDTKLWVRTWIDQDVVLRVRFEEGYVGSAEVPTGDVILEYASRPTERILSKAYASWSEEEARESKAAIKKAADSL